MVSLRDKIAVLPLLSFGAGAADGFAFHVLGGVFTANMTGNAVVAAMVYRPDHVGVASGALSAIGAFALALLAGFRMTRHRAGAALVVLVASASCHAGVVLLWWLWPGRVIAIIAGSAAAMAFQTVAAKRDCARHVATTTYATGTLTDLIEDIVDGAAGWLTVRWLPLVALPAGAAAAAAVTQARPELTPLLPLLATTACVVMLARAGVSNRRPAAPAGWRTPPQ